MKINHSFFLSLAFNLAYNHLGKTKKNPSVGCIVVRNNTVISSGVTSLNGRPHAEFNALNKKLNFKNSIMYLTLEPCTHYGLTPPCTNIIKQKKISKVYYSYNDPDLRTYRKAKKILHKSKINLKKINYNHNNFYKGYFLNKNKNLPLIDAKLAISNDYFTICKNSKWITNYRSRKVGHFLRSKYDCIISTSTTINNDNSLLNCRIAGLNNHQPDLIIIDRNLKLKKNLKIYSTLKKRTIYIFTLSNKKIIPNHLKNHNIKIFKIPNLETKKDFIFLIKKIFKVGKRRVFVETGLTFINKLMKFKLINDLYLFKSKKNLKSKGYNNCKVKNLKKVRLSRKINVNLNQDSLYRLRIK